MEVRRRVRVPRKRRRKRFTRGMTKTLFLFLVFVLLLFVAMVLRIYTLNRDHGDVYKKQVFAQQSYTNKVLKYRRGAIKDRNETILAQSVRRFQLVLEPRTILAKEDVHKETVTQLVQYFQANAPEIEQILTDNPKSMFQYVEGYRELTKEQVSGFQKLMKENKDVQGVWFEETFQRIYPLDSIASNIVGFTSSENEGTYGIEGTYNEQLNGRTGREYGYFDANMNFQRTVKKASNGNSVVLTIDANVQRVIEKLIKQYNKDVGTKNIAVMVMNPNNGEILAMASQNSYDLNNPRDLSSMYTQEEIEGMDETTATQNLMAMWSNFCIAFAYEPGSTFKPFTVAAALDEGQAKDSDYYECPGMMNIAGTDIRCSVRSGHGNISLQKGVMELCNCVMMQISSKLGRDQFSKYNHIFGFGQKTGIDLPGEATGQIHAREDLNPVELATSSFGQTQSVTMIQMAAGFSSLVNGGDYYQPHLVKEVQNENGAVVESVTPVVVKKTVSENTSRLLRKYLLATVEEGTAGPAKVKGYSIGGKTGTAQKRPVEEKNYILSFIGCVPAEDPQAVIYVIIDEPNVEEQAHSTYATEFSSKIMKKILPFLGIYPETN
ncbi:MAG: peptidoglycan glycosyltransferase [Eubacterium sp.]|nr:peptidoglycan glycosyltransferase [Eubacterium sp.]